MTRTFDELGCWGREKETGKLVILRAGDLLTIGGDVFSLSLVHGYPKLSLVGDSLTLATDD